MLKSKKMIIATNFLKRERMKISFEISSKLLKAFLMSIY